jgi:hypothetical protein
MVDSSTLLVDGASAIALVVALTALVRYVAERRERRRTRRRQAADDSGGGGGAAVVIVLLAAAGAVALFQLAGHAALKGANYYRNLTIFLVALLACLVAVSAAAIRQFAGDDEVHSPVPLHNVVASAAAFLLLACLIGGIVTGVVPIMGVNVLPVDTPTPTPVLVCTPTPTPEPTPTHRAGATPTPTPRPSPTAPATKTPAQTPLPSPCSTPG